MWQEGSCDWVWARSTSPKKKNTSILWGLLKAALGTTVRKNHLREIHPLWREPCKPCTKKHFETHYFWYTHTVHLWCENKRQINNNGIEVFQTRKMRCFPRRVAIFRWQQSLWPSPSTRGLLSQELLGAIGQCLSRGAQFLKGDFVFLEPTIFQGRSVKTSGV